MLLNLCIRCNCDTIEEAQTITDTIKSVMASHPEAAINSTVNARLAPEEAESHAMPKQKGKTI